MVVSTPRLLSASEASVTVTGGPPLRSDISWMTCRTLTPGPCLDHHGRAVGLYIRRQLPQLRRLGLCSPPCAGWRWGQIMITKQLALDRREWRSRVRGPTSVTVLSSFLIQALLAGSGVVVARMLGVEDR